MNFAREEIHARLRFVEEHADFFRLANLFFLPRGIRFSPRRAGAGWASDGAGEMANGLLL